MVRASQDEALLAVDLYNRVGRDRSLEAFFVHMHIAWLYLLHSEFLKSKIDYRYHEPNGRLVYVDGEPKTWELQRCVSERWSEGDPVRLNLELTIGIRNRVEHRWQGALTSATAGWAQALVINYEHELCTHFGTQFSLQDELRFPLFLSTLTAKGAERVIAAQKALPPRVRRFIADFHSDLDDSVTSDQRYEFRVHLVPKLGSKTEADVAMTFVREEELTENQRSVLSTLGDTGLVVVRERVRPVVNAGLFRPAQAARQIDARLPFRFGLYQHWPVVWHKLEVRPPTKSERPERTDERYCLYDASDGRYLYTPAFIDKVVKLLNSADKWRTFFGSDPPPPAPDSQASSAKL